MSKAEEILNENLPFGQLIKSAVLVAMERYKDYSIKTLESIVEIKEKERREWADMVIKKQTRIEELQEREEFLNEILAEYKCDFDSLKQCVSKILTMTDNKDIIELINDTNFHLCANMK